MANIREIFSYRNISAAIEAVKTGIPDRLPDVFNTITEDVIGNETTYHKFYGMRKLANRTEYTAGAKHYASNKVDQQPVILTSFKGFVNVQDELLIPLRDENSLSVQKNGKNFIERKVRELKTRFENNRIAHKVQLLRKGAYWYSNEGVLLQSSSGSVDTVDFAVPAGNQGQIGGIIGASWATDTTDIYQHIVNLKKKAIQATGRPLKHAFYGTSIASWIFKNASFKYYFQHYPMFQQAFATKPGEIPNGFMDLEWHAMGDVFWENEAGSVVQGWDDDVVTFTPEIDRDVYTHFMGSEVIPTSMGVQVGEEISTANTAVVYGMHAYSIQTVDPLSIKLIVADNSMPVWKNGLDMYIADVAP